MKNTLRVVSVLLVVSMLAVMLVSCGGKLSGTWMSGNENMGTKLEFKGDVVKVSVYVLGVTKAEPSELHYKVEDGKYLTWAIDGDEEDAVSVSFVEGKDDNGKYIEIGGVKYYKQ